MGTECGCTRRDGLRTDRAMETRTDQHSRSRTQSAEEQRTRRTHRNATTRSKQGNLEKRFGAKTAVRGLSLAVPRGTIFRISWSERCREEHVEIKMLLGLRCGQPVVRPECWGMPVGDVEVRRRIGFLPEDFRFYDWLTATELLLLQLHAGVSAECRRRGCVNASQP